MSSKLAYLMLEHPQYQDEIRLLDLHNPGFHIMTLEYHQLTSQILTLDETQHQIMLRQCQHKHTKLKQSIQSILVKHALAATL